MSIAGNETVALIGVGPIAEALALQQKHGRGPRETS